MFDNLIQWTMTPRLDTVVDYPSSEKNGNTRLCPNYRTISLISHPGQVILRVILKRLVGMPGRAYLARGTNRFQIAEEYYWTDIQLKLLVEKQHQKELFRNFIDVKKAFDRVWHDGLWRVLKEYNIDHRLIDVIRSLYDDMTSALFLNGTVGNFLQATLEV